MKKYLSLGLVLIAFFGIYTFFWAQIFAPKKHLNKKGSTQVQTGSSEQVLSSSAEQSSKDNLPSSYSIEVTPRKQAFGLSCEFAAASSVLFEYTKDQQFNIANEKQAEELLMQKVGTSQNPNLGIRMGDSTSFDKLLENMNQKFGGTQYYGVHAPAFIDLFAQYGMAVKLIRKEDALISVMRAIFSNHFVMAWIKLGNAKPQDNVIPGEHTVVAYSYDENGFSVMDPGNGAKYKIKYNDFLKAISDFPLPLLEVYPSKDQIELNQLLPMDKQIGLSRSNLSVSVANASGEVGKGNQLASILKDFGYNINGVVSLKTREEGLKVNINESMKDYLFLLKKDMTAANYNIASISSELSETSSQSAVITIGE